MARHHYPHNVIFLLLDRFLWRASEHIYLGALCVGESQRNARARDDRVRVVPLVAV